jgi:hypothetical protein
MTYRNRDGDGAAHSFEIGDMVRYLPRNHHHGRVGVIERLSNAYGMITARFGDDRVSCAPSDLEHDR